MRGQVVLEIKQADQLGLLQQRQAEDGADALLLKIRIRRKRVRGRGVVQNQALPCPEYGAEQRFRHLRRRHRLLPELDLDRLVLSSGLGFDPRRIAPQENEQAAFGPGMFECQRHQGLDEPIEYDFAGNSLRGLHHGPRNENFMILCGRGLPFTKAWERHSISHSKASDCIYSLALSAIW